MSGDPHTLFHSVALCLAVMNHKKRVCFFQNMQFCINMYYMIQNTQTLFLHQTLCLSLVQEQFSQVLDAMFEVLVQPQDHVIDQGDDGDNFYVIERYVF